MRKSEERIMKLNRVSKNAFWIISCRIVQSVFALLVNILTARYFGPANFGLINYAASIVAFFAPIMSLGITEILVNELIKEPEKEGEILGTSLVMTLVSAVSCIFLIAIFVNLVNPGETDTMIVTVLYSFLLIFQSLELIQYWFQSKYMSRYTSLTVLFAYIIVSAYKMFLLLLKKSIYWFAISHSLYYFLIAIVLLGFYKKLGGLKFKFSFSRVKCLWKQGKHYIIPGVMGLILAQSDRIMLKLMCNNDEVGFYSAAISIAGLTSFVFTAIITSMRPLILENKTSDEKSYEKNIVRLYGIVIYLSLLQSIFISLLAKPIVFILYGNDYLSNTAPMLQIVVWYTAFSYVGGVRTVWILAEQKQKYLWIISFFGMIFNIALNYLLIPQWGGNGAAIATLITQIFTNIILIQIIKPLRKNNTLVLRSLNFKNILN